MGHQVLQAETDDGDTVMLFGGFREQDAPVSAGEKDRKAVAEWINNPDAPTTDELAALIRKFFKEQEQFKVGMRVFIHEAVEIMKTRSRTYRENISRPVSTHDKFGHGYTAGMYVASSLDAQLMIDVLNSAILELER